MHEEEYGDGEDVNDAVEDHFTRGSEALNGIGVEYTWRDSKIDGLHTLPPSARPQQIGYKSQTRQRYAAFLVYAERCWVPNSPEVARPGPKRIHQTKNMAKTTLIKDISTTVNENGELKPMVKSYARAKA